MPNDPHHKLGRAELRRVNHASRHAFLAAFIFSSFVNLLMLTSPLYMLQIYDRVLLSRSQETLVALTGLVTFLFIIMALLDYARSKVLSRLGARLQNQLDHRVLSAAFQRLSIAPRDIAAHNAQRDLETVSRFWASPLLIAILDLPWAPIFLIALFIFHPLLGWFAVAGAILLIALTLFNQRSSEANTNSANLAALAADRQAENLKSESELIRALGMTGNAFQRWQQLRQEALNKGLNATDTLGGFSTITKTLRLFMQSAILGVGAWLVLKDQLSPGAMIAGSILMGRALQPIEIVISKWANLTRSRAAFARLSELLSTVAPARSATVLPRPNGRLEVQNLAVMPPGENHAVLRGVSFTLEPGQALGVIGLSGSGKSSLARALAGIWGPAAGSIRLDSAALDQYDPDILGSYIGYLPQRVTLFDGTIAENIARLAPNPDPEKIIAAAKTAAVHDLIVRLPQGYDTQVSTAGGQLSGGQTQRIGLARAFYNSPVIMILDEPNSNLDNDGSLALNQAIRSAKAAGCSVLIMAHRPAAIQECDLLLVLNEGLMQKFGPRDLVLQESVVNAHEVSRAVAPSPAKAGGMA